MTLYRRCSRRSPGAVAKHGGRVVALRRLENAPIGDAQPRSVMILVEWPSREAVRHFLDAPELADLHPLREDGTRNYLWWPQEPPGGPASDPVWRRLELPVEAFLRAGVTHALVELVGASAAFVGGQHDLCGAPSPGPLFDGGDQGASDALPRGGRWRLRRAPDNISC
jgi:uncharacterized protein (DUF1330 family)